MRLGKPPIPGLRDFYPEEIDIDLGNNWDEHLEKVHPLIKKLDQKNAQSLVDASKIVISNSTK